MAIYRAPKLYDGIILSVFRLNKNKQIMHKIQIEHTKTRHDSCYRIYEYWLRVPNEEEHIHVHTAEWKKILYYMLEISLIRCSCCLQHTKSNFVNWADIFTSNSDCE